MIDNGMKVRKLDFRFDDSLPFQSNPANPACGNVINCLSILGPCFERYFIKAFRQAMPLIQDEKLLQQAEWFCAQEAQHSRHHMMHVNALEKQYPGVKATMDAVMDSYMSLLANESLEFHLAYTSIVELSFGPTAKFIIEQRAPLLSGCQPVIASLVLWHFVEEFEHRNCAIDFYNTIVGSYWFRLKTIPAVMRHLNEAGKIVTAGLNKCVSLQHNPYGHDNFANIAQGIPKASLASYGYHLFLSQMPFHKPDRLQTPEWVKQWFRDEEQGCDMTHYYPANR